MDVGANIGPIGREFPAGGRIGRFTVVRRLARGGMAEVYLAKEQGPADVERLVALKLILPHMADESRFLSMFKTEARVAATLDHPNIAQVRDAGEVDGEPFLAMEFVHGRTVHSMLRASGDRGGTLPLGCGLALVIGACAGLHYAHERRDLKGAPLDIVHRDVSPSNLMCRHDGAIKLLDFGIAKAASQTSATATGFFKGKAGYMSPEQCADEPIDRRSDVFNLGILLYELTTSRRAFFGDNPVAVINKIANGRFTPPSLHVDGYPPELERIVMRALAPAADARFATAEAMQLELEAFARARQLDVSAAALAELMRDLFGETPYPSIPSELGEPMMALHTEVGVSSVALTEPARRRRWWAPAGVLGVVAIGLATAAWSLGGDAAQSRPVEEVPAAAATPADAPAAAGTLTAEPRTHDETAVDDESTPEPPEPPEPPVSGTEPSTTKPVSTKPKATKRRRTRRGSLGKRGRKKEQRKGPAGMYP